MYIMLKYRLFVVVAYIVGISGGATAIFIGKAIWDALNAWGRYSLVTVTISFAIGLMMQVNGWSVKPPKETLEIEPGNK